MSSPKILPPLDFWVGLFHLPVEGKLIRGFEGLDVGDRVRVELIGTDVERGFIDFVRAGRGQGGLRFACPGRERVEGDYLYLSRTILNLTDPVKLPLA